MLEPWALQYKPWKKNLYYSLIERRNLRKAQAIHSIARCESENIATLCPDATVWLVPNGIHWSDFSSPPSSAAFYQTYPHLRNQKLILFLGRIDPKKGLDLLASAFAAIHQKVPDAHLVIAGPDSIGFLPTAQQYFANAHCLEAVTFTGMLSGDIKYSALATASVYVAPSYSEGFSMSILEGMASGLPCVFTNACNFPEAANVAKIVSVDQEQIAQAIYWCLANPEDAVVMGDHARQFISEHYTWDKIAIKLIGVYQSILNQGDSSQ